MSDQRKTIKDLPEDERPREKLLKYGADKLSDSELLAILLRTGTRGKSVIEMAEEILKNAGGTFKGLAGKDTEEITKVGRRSRQTQRRLSDFYGNFQRLWQRQFRRICL
jgi:DNA repair protein RadC